MQICVYVYSILFLPFLIILFIFAIIFCYCNILLLLGQTNFPIWQLGDGGVGPLAARSKAKQVRLENGELPAASPVERGVVRPISSSSWLVAACAGCVCRAAARGFRGRQS